MSFEAPVAGIIPGMMSLSLLGRSVKMTPQYWGNGKKKANGKKMIKGFIPIMIGTTMIKPVAGMVAGL